MFLTSTYFLLRYPTMSKVSELKAHQSRVLHMSLSPDGTTVCSAAGDETLRFWKVIYCSYLALIPTSSSLKSHPLSRALFRYLLGPPAEASSTLASAKWNTPRTSCCFSLETFGPLVDESLYQCHAKYFAALPVAIKSSQTRRNLLY